MQNQTPQAVQSAHDLLVWLIPQLDKLSRARRFALGERLEAGVLAVLERLVEAAYTRDKEQALQQANLRLDIVRHLWRAAHELQLIPTRRYEHGARLFDDLGKQIGGWLKSRRPARL
jgi:hypothetical protein